MIKDASNPFLGWNKAEILHGAMLCKGFFAIVQSKKICRSATGLIGAS